MPTTRTARVGTLWHTRAELNVDTATDTEYGALKTDTDLSLGLE